MGTLSKTSSILSSLMALAAASPSIAAPSSSGGGKEVDSEPTAKISDSPRVVISMCPFLILPERCNRSEELVLLNEKKQTAVVFRAPKGVEITMADVSSARAKRIAFSQGGDLYYLTWSDTVPLKASAPVGPVWHGGEIRAIAFSPDDNLVAFNSGGRGIYVYDFASNKTTPILADNRNFAVTDVYWKQATDSISFIGGPWGKPWSEYVLKLGRKQGDGSVASGIGGNGELVPIGEPLPIAAGAQVDYHRDRTCTIKPALCD